MPRFADYHRTVVGYHGTRRSTALRVVQGLEGYKRSENSDDWLGHGIYFWEYAPKQAWAWAEQRRRSQAWGEEVAVLASMIRLGNCFDLLDPDNLDEYSRGIVVSTNRWSVKKETSPKENHNKSKYLDCAVFQFAYAAFEVAGKTRSTPVGPSSFPPANGSGPAAGCTNTPISSCVCETRTVYLVRGW